MLLPGHRGVAEDYLLEALFLGAAFADLAGLAAGFLAAALAGFAAGFFEVDLVVAMGGISF